MAYVARLLAAISSVLFVGGVSTLPSQTPTPTATRGVWAPQNASWRVSDPIQARLPAPTTTVFLPQGECAHLWPVAQQAGWTPELWPELNRIMWRESRCHPDSHNTKLNKDGSADLGLMQINDRSWCMKNRWNPTGYLQGLGILRYCAELFIPRTNLLAAKALYDYSKERGVSGFQPWAG
jgi:hypothetical protein